MTQIYSDESRETDTYALPDVEVFYAEAGELEHEMLEPGEQMEAGWYWWSCFPGCTPDSDPVGPFETEQEAINDAQNID